MPQSSQRTSGHRRGRPVVVSVFGTRPQLIKLSAMWKPLEAAFRSILVDSGQHYDSRLAGAIYAGTRLRPPDACLGVRAKTPAAQISKVADALDRFLSRRTPDAVVTYGDTSTTAGAAVAAAYRNIPLAHVEAGLRSFDMSAPEEKNRLLADRLSTWRFCPTSASMANLRSEGIVDGVFGVGDVLYETYLNQRERLRPHDTLDRLNLSPGSFYLLTCHRAETVDNPRRLRSVVDIILSLDRPVVFPVHPRTRKQLEDSDLMRRLKSAASLHLTRPLDHASTLALILTARMVLTDSGGVQRESYWSRTPCLVLRDRTEWGELVKCGALRLVGLDPDQVRQAMKSPPAPVATRDPHFRKRHSARRIVDVLVRHLH